MRKLYVFSCLLLLTVGVTGGPVPKATEVAKKNADETARAILTEEVRKKAQDFQSHAKITVLRSGASPTRVEQSGFLVPGSHNPEGRLVATAAHFQPEDSKIITVRVYLASEPTQGYTAKVVQYDQKTHVAILRITDRKFVAPKSIPSAGKLPKEGDPIAVLQGRRAEDSWITSYGVVDSVDQMIHYICRPEDTVGERSSGSVLIDSTGSVVGMHAQADLLFEQGTTDTGENIAIGMVKNTSRKGHAVPIGRVFSAIPVPPATPVATVKTASR